jgi:hypothetical protein
MKKKILITLSAVLVVTLSACTDFLEEESYGSTTKIFDEENGIKALVYQSYTKINNLYGGGGQWPLMTELGTDIYLRGRNQGDAALGEYYGLDATNGNVGWLWNHCYKALANINTFFETVDQTPFANESEKESYKAEMLVMRALFLWVVTETWGDTYLPMTTDETEGLEARRSPRAKFYEEIISALEKAITMLPDERTTEAGRIDMPTAKAFLARIYLYDEQWDNAAALATEVIEGGYGLSLTPSLIDLWDADKTNSEFIWTTNFTEDTAFGINASYYNWYAMYIDRFPGIRTELGWTGYGGCQAIPSIYFMDIFNRDADLRWSDLHQWVWYYNDPADNVSAFPDNRWRLYTDTAMYLCPDVLPAAEMARMKKTYTVFDRSTLFNAEGIPQDRWTFIGMKKFYDSSRPGDMADVSDRSFPVMRLGELYLIRAEARIRSTANRDLAGAAADITELRRRAVNPGKSEYADAMKVTENDMTLDFILEERARELFGEWQRRFDLKRFGRLIDQVRAFNPDAKNNIKDYHVVRPIPQTQFDGMPDWTTLGQNEGY